MRRSLGVRVLGAGLLASLMVPAVASADSVASPGACRTRSASTRMWVIIAAVLVIFMQAGFTFLEIGFSRGKNAGTIVAKILDELLDRRDHVLGGRLRVRLRRSRSGTSSATRGFFLRDYGDPRDGVPDHGLLRRDGRVEVALPVRLLRRLAGDRLGHDARADQVRRLHHLRGRLLRADLPDRLALGLRRRLAAGQRRHAGLRRLDGRPPDRRDRRPARRCCCSAPRKGKYGPDGKPRAIPGHNMPLFGLGVLHPAGSAGSGSTRARRSNALDSRFAEVALVTQPRGRAPACSARSPRRT